MIKLDESNKTRIFIDIIHLLWQYNDAGLRSIAEEANVHWTTLYGWRSGKTIAPRSDTLFRVAAALGYDIKLVKKKLQLRRVK